MKQQVRVIESQSAAGEDNVLHHSSFLWDRAQGVPATGDSSGGTNYTAHGLMTLNNLTFIINSEVLKVIYSGVDWHNLS